MAGTLTHMYCWAFPTKKAVSRENVVNLFVFTFVIQKRFQLRYFKINLLLHFKALVFCPYMVGNVC